MTFLDREPPPLSKRDEEISQRYGGSDNSDYQSPDNLRSCDKGGHKERSLYNDPNHQDYWRKHGESTDIYRG
jgi:hypothetical protein